MIKDSYHVILATLSARSLRLERLKYGGVTITGFQLQGLRSGDVGLFPSLSLSCLFKYKSI